MNKIHAFIVPAFLLCTGLFVFSCTKADPCAGSSSASSASCAINPDNADAHGSGAASGSASHGGGGSGSGSGSASGSGSGSGSASGSGSGSGSLAPAINPEHTFNTFSDYCTQINTYASTNPSITGNAKAFGCWTLATANGQPGCKSGDVFSLCAVYIFDPYRTFNSYGCGAMKGALPGIKTTTQIGNNFDANLIYAYVFNPGGGPAPDGFIFDSALGQISINSVQGVTGSLFLPNEKLIFTRANSAADLSVFTASPINKAGCSAFPDYNPHSK